MALLMICPYCSALPEKAHLPNGIFGGLFYEEGVGRILGKKVELPCTGDCLRPVGGIQLTIDAGRVGFDGPRGYKQLACDLLVGPAKRHQGKHLQLSS